LASWLQSSSFYAWLNTLMTHDLGGPEDITGESLEEPQKERLAAIEMRPALISGAKEETVAV